MPSAEPHERLEGPPRWVFRQRVNPRNMLYLQRWDGRLGKWRYYGRAFGSFATIELWHRMGIAYLQPDDF